MLPRYGTFLADVIFVPTCPVNITSRVATYIYALFTPKVSTPLLEKTATHLRPNIMLIYF